MIPRKICIYRDSRNPFRNQGDVTRRGSRLSFPNSMTTTTIFTLFPQRSSSIGSGSMYSTVRAEEVCGCAMSLPIYDTCRYICTYLCRYYLLWEKSSEMRDEDVVGVGVLRSVLLGRNELQPRALSCPLCIDVLCNVNQ
jgi:hypothetical protein